MNSSGIKRGLAAGAISALAVTGLPFLASSASANPAVDQLPANAVVLQTPDDLGAASIKNDGQNATVHLLANAGSDAVQVRFEYSTTGVAGSWSTIATVGRSNGVFSTEWAPPTSVYNLDVHVRATAINNVGTDGASDDNVATVTSNADSIDISNAAGSAVGVFDQPYATTGGGRATAATSELGAASATTSDVSSNPAVKFSTPYNTTTTDEDVAGTPADGSRSVSGPVDFSGYNWGTATDADQAIVKANVGTGGSDAEAVTLYQQKITAVTAAATSPTVQGSKPTSATVTVKDQNGNPVVGAEVVREDNNAIKYTDSKGEASFDNLTGSTSGTTYKFYVNTGDDVTYNNGADFERSVTVTSYSASAASITPSSADGTAFDDNEYSTGDITAVVKDQNGNPLDGQVVRYYWTVTPFDATTGYPKDLPESSATSQNGGVATLDFPTGQPSGTYVLHTYINQDGTPGQGDKDLGGQALTVKAGQADIEWADGSVAQAQSNSTKTFGASLVLEDGTPLAGRNILLNWSPTGNAIVAAQSAQPAGTTRTGDTTAKTTTGADGSFAVALTDPPATGTPPTPANEKGGKLTASTTATPKIGDAGDSSDLTVDFLKSTAPADASDITVKMDDLINGEATPGRPVDLDISVTNADGDTLTDYPVTVSVDHGFLSPDAETASKLTADPAAAEGGLYGEWKPVGTSKELSTDDTGATGIVAAIEDDKGFDTSDTVTTTVTIKAGDITVTKSINFESIDPLNGGAVKVERAAANQQSVTILPKAPTNESVEYNVFTTDQFGNLVEGENVDLTDDLAGAYMNTHDDSETVQSQLKNQSPALEVSSDVEGDQTVTGTWTAPTTTWTDGQPLVDGFQKETTLGANSTKSGTKKLTDDGETVNWYMIDFAKSTYTMTHDTADTVPVGSTVLETYKAIDQNGEPIEGVQVGFFRTGPDQYQDGDFNSYVTTNSAGQASYVFAGADEGKATIQGLITDYSNYGGDQIVPESRATDTVTFARKAVHYLNMKLQAWNNGGHDDVLHVNANKYGAGLTATIYRHTKHGLKKVTSVVLNGHGNNKVTVADKNGRSFTKYVARVAATDATHKAHAKRRVR
ncbi:hypothetical protein [Nocardioides panaciterrulae]|uniref:Uncharacterized protein n=1 Tax=Nocardioides panaciterrulae TaxID=661492 RepID=A0A7Y9E8B6_9ACTN|nr:hypothetical protein [Nocardioides panaciterrulae]NYD42837.1 hypothetical protein [Nocardioides panaciterrulae]